MSALSALLNTYRSASVTEREKGTYFEELICAYLRNEATYRDLYDKVWMYGDWAKEQGLDGRDTGIDLVARTQGTVADPLRRARGHRELQATPYPRRLRRPSVPPGGGGPPDQRFPRRRPGHRRLDAAAVVRSGHRRRHVMTLKALLFDVDGTLAETEQLHRQAFNATFAAMGPASRSPDRPKNDLAPSWNGSGGIPEPGAVQNWGTGAWSVIAFCSRSPAARSASGVSWPRTTRTCSPHATWTGSSLPCTRTRRAATPRP